MDDETKRYRVGRDFWMNYEIVDGAKKAIDLTNALNVTVTVVRASKSEYTKEDFDISGNVVTIQWSSKENTEVGTYRVTIEWDFANSNSETGYNHPIVDFYPAFEIVTLSTMENADDNQTLTGTAVDYGKDGASAFEIWKAKYGTSTSTEADYIAYLRQPATITAESYENGTLKLNIGG
jgi:glycyl-tRNA synthetase alpha subunit